MGCVHCLKLNKRYFNRYYPTKRSLQLHLASMHGQQNQSGQRTICNPVSEQEACVTTKTSELPTLSSYPSVPNTSEIYVPINAINSSNHHQSQQTQAISLQNQNDPDQGQQIIQQFQIQLPDQTQLVDQQTQQIQIIQSDPNNPEQPQVIT